MRIVSVVLALLVLTGLQSARAATEIQLSQPSIGDLALPARLRTSVASNGRGYLVAWEAGAGSEDDVTSIYIRALGADGVPLGPFPTFLGLGREPRAVWNGHEYLLVWGITSSTTGALFTPSVVGVRLREDGSLIDAQPVALVTEVNPFSTLTTVAWNGSRYLVTWDRGMALVDADLQHFKLVLMPSIGGSPTYSATSSGSFMVLSQAFSVPRLRLVVIPISPTGELGTVNLLEGGRGNIVGVDGGYVMLRDDETNLHLSSLLGDGTLLSSSIVGPGSTGFPRLATRDGRIVSSWESIPNATQTRVCVARFDGSPRTSCSTVTPAFQHDPSIGTASTSILAVWSDKSDGRDNVRGLATPVTTLPLVSAGAGTSVSDASSTPSAERRADGTVAVAWSEYNQTSKHFEIHFGGRSSQGGKLAERAVFATGSDQTMPAIALGNGRTMALWEEGAAASSKIRMTILDDVTKSVIATLPLASGTSPSVSYDGKEWLATWQSPAGLIRYALIDSDGNAIASGALPGSTSTSFSQAPAVAWSGKTFFVVWHEAIAAAPGVQSGERIIMATLDLGGALPQATTLDAADASLAFPSAASSGGRVLVSWGSPAGTLRQMLFDASGKQLGHSIEFASPFAVSRSRTHAMASGFATLAGRRICLTSSDGRGLDSIDVPETTAGGDFAVDAANRFILIYSRTLATPLIATFTQTIELPRRHASDH